MTTLLTPNDGVQFLWPTRICSGALSLAEDESFTQSAAVRGLLAPILKQVGVTSGQQVDIRSERLALTSRSHIPIRASRADLCAWVWIDAQGTPATQESGSIHLHDPRAGANLTVLPGLPWGRPAILHPAPGTAVIWPGWLTWTLLPISEGHRINAVYVQIEVDPLYGRTGREPT